MSSYSLARRPAPLATIVVGLLTAAMSLVALAHPDVLRSLERHPTPGGSWMSWRLLTSLLVHDGWLPLAFNLAGFAIVGSAAERRLGPTRWIVLYLVGGLVGELVGIRWQPLGAGNSVASFGMVGGLLVAHLGRESTPLAPAAPPAFATLYAAEWVLVYTGLELGGVAGATIAGVLCGPLTALAVRSRQRAVPRAHGVVLAAGTLALALLLCAFRDIHGPPLIAGAIVGWMLRRDAASFPSR